MEVSRRWRASARAQYGPCMTPPRVSCAGSGGWDPQEIAVPVAVDCVGHGDLAPWNLVFDGDQMVRLIDFDFVGPSNRVWDFAYLAYHLVPCHPTEHLPGSDGAANRTAAAGCGSSLPPTTRPTAGTAGRLRGDPAARHGRPHQRPILDGDPAFDVHRDHDYVAGSRAAATSILTYALADPSGSRGGSRSANNQLAGSLGSASPSSS